MSKTTPPRNAAQKNAQHYFKAAELQSDTLAKKQRKKERVAGEANTARLRELRLAKEAADKQEQDKLAGEASANGVVVRPKRARPVKKSIVRMSY